MKPWLLLISILMTLACGAVARADNETKTPQSPPLITDDPDTPGNNVWEINILLKGELTPDRRDYELPLLDLNYGIGDSLQLKYEVPWVLVDLNGGPAVSSIGNSVVGVKYNFLKAEKDGVNVSIYPQYEYVTPESRLVRNGLADDGAVVEIPLLIAKDTPDFNYAFNLGYNKPTKSEHSDFFNASFGAGSDFTPRWSLMAEIYGEWAFSGDEKMALVNLGTMHRLDEKTLIYWSVGHQLGVNPDGQSPLFALVGFRVFVQ